MLELGRCLLVSKHSRIINKSLIRCGWTFYSWIEGLFGLCPLSGLLFTDPDCILMLAEYQLSSIICLPELSYT